MDTNTCRTRSKMRLSYSVPCMKGAVVFITPVMNTTDKATRVEHAKHTGRRCISITDPTQPDQILAGLEALALVTDLMWTCAQDGQEDRGSPLQLASLGGRSRYSGSASRGDLSSARNPLAQGVSDKFVPLSKTSDQMW
jgi:hypothetical protein